jgi:hypothetical protein
MRHPAPIDFRKGGSIRNFSSYSNVAWSNGTVTLAIGLVKRKLSVFNWEIRPLRQITSEAGVAWKFNSTGERSSNHLPRIIKASCLVHIMIVLKKLYGKLFSAASYRPVRVSRGVRDIQIDLGNI